jgi:hypothetical protein
MRETSSVFSFTGGQILLQRSCTAAAAAATTAAAAATATTATTPAASASATIADGDYELSDDDDDDDYYDYDEGRSVPNGHTHFAHHNRVLSVFAKSRDSHKVDALREINIWLLLHIINFYSSDLKRRFTQFRENFFPTRSGVSSNQLFICGNNKMAVFSVTTATVLDKLAIFYV